MPRDRQAALSARGSPDLVVVGAGPCGIAVACAARRAGLTCVAIDRGSLLASVRRYPDSLRFFSTPDLLEIDGAPFPCPDDKPRRDDTLRYWAAVARSREIEVRPYREAASVQPDGRGFRIDVARRDGGRERIAAGAVVLATGAFEATPMGIPGEGLPHVSRYFTSPLDHVGERTLIVGGRNSACEAALVLARAGVDVTIAHRGAAFDPRHVKYWILPDLENRIREGRIRALPGRTLVAALPGGARFRRTDGSEETVEADRVLALTGYGPDCAFLARCGVPVSSDGVPEHDPRTFQTPVPRLYVAGVLTGGAVSGRVFVENGRFHGDAVVAALARS